VDAFTEPFAFPFMQRALIEIVALSIAGGVLGSWIVLRRLAFFTHAVGTATFPGLVVAAAWGIAPPLAALATALAFAAALERAARGRRIAYDAATGLLLVGALAVGALLASDVYRSGAGVDTLLFGSLLGLSDGDLWFAGGVAVLALSAGAALHRAWLASGFDPPAAAALGVPAVLADRLLLGAIALAVVASLAAVGSLLAAALFVVPAATVRLLAPSVRTLVLGAIGLALAEGVAGLWLAYELDAPPGATIALLGGGAFLLVSIARAVAVRRAAGRRLAPLGAAALLALACAGCGTTAGAAPDAAVRAVATTTQVADLVRAVGGPRVGLTRILRPNADPHDYEPRPSDAVAVARARLIFRSGGELDGWLAPLERDAGGDARTVDLSTAAMLRGRQGATDPHWWQDPRNGARAVERIAAELARADPPGATSYRRRAAAYAARVRELDRRLAACFARIPPAARVLVTNHDAFGYLAARYGLRVIGTVIPSRSTEGQASAGDVAALARAIRAAGVRAVFAERSVNPSLARNIARDAGARIVATLYADTLGPRGSAGATYLGALAANAEAIAAGVTGGAVHCRAGP